MSMVQDDSTLTLGLSWLRHLIDMRLHDPDHTELPDAPSIVSDNSPFTFFVRTYEPSPDELAVFLLAFVPHIAPGFIDAAIGASLKSDADLIEVGGVRLGGHRGMQPTGETALWLLAGNDLRKRAEMQRMFRSDHWFAKACALTLEPPNTNEPAMSGRLIVDEDLIEFVIHGRITPPRFSKDFPAEHISTDVDWSDLVLHDNTKRQIREIENWITHNETVMVQWGLGKRVKPGYRALFFGPPGTGKTLTATLLGKHTGRDVFRIDLSKVVSKYVGETEQNLARLFDRAESKNWILFFDEADSLFSKRTDIRDAHDKYANQEVAFLLQRIEGYDGLVILATNQRNNIDEAFVRRFQSIIHFPMPTSAERHTLWTKAIPDQLVLAADLDLASISDRFEVSGAAIMNIVHHCSIEALANNVTMLDRALLEAAVKREFTKEGKIV